MGVFKKKDKAKTSASDQSASSASALLAPDSSESGYGPTDRDLRSTTFTPSAFDSTQLTFTADGTTLNPTTFPFSPGSIELFHAVLKVLREVWQGSCRPHSPGWLFSEFASGDKRCFRFDLVTGDIRAVPLTGNPKSVRKARSHKMPEDYPLSLFKGGQVHLDCSHLGHHAMSDGYGPCVQIASIERNPIEVCVDVTYTVHWAERQESDAFSSDMAKSATCPSQLEFSGSTQTQSDGQIQEDFTEKPARHKVLQEVFRLLQALHEEHHREYGQESFLDDRPFSYIPPGSEPGIAQTHLLRLEIDRQGNVFGYRGAPGQYTEWRIPKVPTEVMEPLGQIRYVPGTSYDFDGTMKGSLPCDSGCLTEPPGKGKGVASPKLLQKMAGRLLGDSGSQPPGIQVEVVSIKVPASGIQDLLVVTLRVRIEG